MALDLNVSDRNGRRPAQRFGRLWNWPQRLDDMGHEPHAGAYANKDNRNKQRITHRHLLSCVDFNVVPDFGLASQDVALGLVLFSQRVLHGHRGAA